MEHIAKLMRLLVTLLDFAFKVAPGVALAFVVDHAMLQKGFSREMTVAGSLLAGISLINVLLKK